MLLPIASELPINKEALVNCIGLSQDGWRAEFAENLRPSLFNKDHIKLRQFLHYLYSLGSWLLVEQRVCYWTLSLVCYSWSDLRPAGLP